MKKIQYFSIATAVLAFAMLCTHCAIAGEAPKADTSEVVETLSEPVDDQTRIDKILEAYRRLPAAEIERMGLDPYEPVAPGTPEADLLFSTWQRRVEELRAVMNSVAKPVTLMEDIILKIKDQDHAFDAYANVTAEDKSAAVADLMPALKELESLVSDVDSAKDFHTIGGWAILSSLLSPKYPTEIRAAAAWAVGTAVKNSYDYQLWALETFEDVHQNAGQVEVDGESVPITIYRNASTLQYLVELLQEGEVGANVPLRLKALYALAAATRGNPDVQQAILTIDADVPLLTMFQEQIVAIPAIVASDSSKSADLLRYLLKVWGFIHDLAEERRYLHVELAHGSEVSKELREQMLALSLLGDELLTAQWIMLALDSFENLEVFTYDYEIDGKMLEKIEKDFNTNCDYHLAASSDVDNSDDDTEIADSSTNTVSSDSTKMRLLESALGFVSSVVRQTSNAEKSVIKSELAAAGSKGGMLLLHYRYVLNHVAVAMCKQRDASALASAVPLLKEVLDRLAPFAHA